MALTLQTLYSTVVSLHFLAQQFLFLFEFGKPAMYYDFEYLLQRVKEGNEFRFFLFLFFFYYYYLNQNKRKR